MEQEKRKAERSATITAIFAFSEALEMLIKEVLEEKPENAFKGKAKIYYNQYRSALRTAHMSMGGFNLETEQLIFNIDRDKSDQYRLLANDMIRLYCHYRNCDITSKENAKDFEEKVKNLEKIQLFSEDFVKKFTLK